MKTPASSTLGIHQAQQHMVSCRQEKAYNYLRAWDERSLTSLEMGQLGPLTWV